MLTKGTVCVPSVFECEMRTPAKRKLISNIYLLGVCIFQLLVFSVAFIAPKGEYACFAVTVRMALAPNDVIYFSFQRQLKSCLEGYTK